MQQDQTDYSNALYIGRPSKSIRRLQLVQNAMAQLLLGERWCMYITPILQTRYWLPICYQAEFNILVLHRLVGPAYLQDASPQALP